MKSIEMISEGFTHKYEFPKNEWYCDKIDPPQLIKEESYAEPSEALRICIDLLVDIYDKEFVKKAFREFDIEDYF